MNRLPARIDNLIDMDPGALAPPVVLLPGDVLRLSTIQIARGRTRLMSARAAASAALAAGAHAGLQAMSRMQIEAHWRPAGQDVVIVPDMIERPMPLLPFVRHAVETYLDLRGCPTHGPLFATVDGDPLDHKNLQRCLVTTAELFGVQGEDLYVRLHRFFERALDGQSDRTAANYMMGHYTVWRIPPRSAPANWPAIAALRRILDDAHPLAGPARTYFGPSAPFTKEEACNLPDRVFRRYLSEALKTDPVALELAAVDWPTDESECRAPRAEMKRLHFAHLYSLWRADRLTSAEIGWLLRLPGGAAQAIHDLWAFIPPEVPTVRRTPRELRPMLVERWRARPEGENVSAFARRMVTEIGLSSIHLADRHLRRAGEIGRRRRGRPRKKGA